MPLAKHRQPALPSIEYSEYPLLLRTGSNSTADCCADGTRRIDLQWVQTIACEREALWATPVVAELGRVHHLKLHRRLELAELTLESAHNLRIG